MTHLPVAASATSAKPLLGGPSPELLELFNCQITKEFSASQLYLSASIWFDERDWEGMAQYMLVESGEERGHALQMIEFAVKKQMPE